MHADLLNSTVAAQFIIAGLWQGLLLVSAAWLALEALPGVASRLTSRTRFVLWMTVFLLAALVPFSTLAEFVHPFSAAAPAAGAAALLPEAHLPASWARILVSIWALASLFALARLLVNVCSLQRLSWTAEPLPMEGLDGELLSLAAKPGLRPVRLCRSSRVDSPVAIGFFRPAIVIPQWLERKLSSAELKQIVTHELAHLERRDDWTNLLQKFVRALFPLNPALLWAERQLCREREMACDDRVLDTSASPRDYAACLTSLAEKRLMRRVPTLAPGAWQRRSELTERVHRILRRRSQPNNAGRGASAVAAAFLGVTLCGGMALARCPQLVTFTEPASQPKHSESASQPKSGEPAQVRRVSDPVGLNKSRTSEVHPPRRMNLRLNTVRGEGSRSPTLASHPSKLRSQGNPVEQGWGTRRLVTVQELRPEAQIILTVWEISPGLPPTRSGWIVFEL